MDRVAGKVWATPAEPLYEAVWRPGKDREIQIYQQPYAAFQKKYDELWPEGWRLYLLNSYVSVGKLLYDAVWRPGKDSEIQLYEMFFDEFQKKYDELWPEARGSTS